MLSDDISLLDEALCVVDQLEVMPAAGPLNASIRPPGSKSITNRALVCAALATGSSRLNGALDSEDTRVMVEALQSLGIQVSADYPAGQITVWGCAGQIPAKSADLYIANSGTTVRFLTAMVALGQGRFRLDGTPRMRERPIQDLLDALNQLGASARSESGSGCPPVVIEAAGLTGGAAEVRGDISSQFLSGLLLAAPYASADVELKVIGDLVSKPYVRMTRAVMRSFGVHSESGSRVVGATILETPVATESFDFIRMPGNQRYLACDYAIEPDASAASYFWAAAAVTGGRVTVEGLSAKSLQGDVEFCRCLELMGCQLEYADNSIMVIGGPLVGIDVDMNAISDTVQTLGAVALFANGPTRIRGVGHIRHKESDRLGDLARELRKLGADVTEHDDGLTITPGPLRGAAIDTYHDHRMAMSLAVAGLRLPNVRINDPGCTQKTYPGFFADLQRVTATANE